MSIDEKLEKFDLCLPSAPKRGGKYSSVKRISGNLWSVSGCGPIINNVGPVGKIGNELTVEDGRNAAKCAVLNFLALISEHIAPLDKIKSIICMHVYVASASDFYEQPKVADGATELLEQLFGKEVGLPTRSAIGMAVLPGNIPVELDGIIEIED